MEQSLFEKMGRSADDSPMSDAEIRRFRGLAFAYPCIAAFAVLFLGVSVGKVALVTVFFAGWVAMQMVVLTPARRRQVLGLAAAESAPADR